MAENLRQAGDGFATVSDQAYRSGDDALSSAATGLLSQWSEVVFAWTHDVRGPNTVNGRETNGIRLETKRFLERYGELAAECDRYERDIRLN